jgi:hypothetical protein
MARHPRVVASAEELRALQELPRSERRDEARRKHANRTCVWELAHLIHDADDFGVADVA